MVTTGQRVGINANLSNYALNQMKFKLVVNVNVNQDMSEIVRVNAKGLCVLIPIKSYSVTHANADKD